MEAVGVRECPLCGSTKRRTLHQLTLTFGGDQRIYYCTNCSMIYASAGNPVNYNEDSIYTLPGAIGSGVTENDKKRLDETAAAIDRMFWNKSISILDVGCAQGGLLNALKSHGFTNLSGMDPSFACVDMTRAAGHHAYHGTLPGNQVASYDLIILSHVLEHIEDVTGALRGAWDWLKPGGHIYIEVPDASRYWIVGAPLLDFNSEHINHFTKRTLQYAIEQAGLRVESEVQGKIIQLPHYVYPALWVLATEPAGSYAAMRSYITEAEDRLRKINNYLEAALEGERRIIIWGVNSYCANIINLPVFQRVKIVQAIDRNPALHGRIACCGVGVVNPDEIRHSDIPIVITTLMSIDSIRADIGARGLPNQVISIPNEVYS